MRIRSLALGFFAAAVLCRAEGLAIEPPETERQVASVLADRCLACHGPTKQEGGYRVDSFAWLKKPGDSGAKPIVAELAAESELFKRLISPDEDARMPAGAPALSTEQIALFEQWIAAGAKVSAELETKPISSWARRSREAKFLEHYPAALPVTALALAKPVLATPTASDGLGSPSDEKRHGEDLSLWTSGYGEALQWQLSETETKLVQRTATAGAHVSDVDLTEDGRLLVVTSGTPGAQGYVELFIRNDAGYQLAWTHTCPDLPADLAFAPDGKHLAVGQSDGQLLIVNLNVEHPELSTTQVSAPHADAILAVGWSTKGDRLITGSRDRTAKIFDTDRWQLIANYDRHERAVGGVAYLDRHPVSLDETGKLRLWSGDDSDRTLAERDNQARFLEQVVAFEDRVWFAMGPDVRSFQSERKTVDDGKDDAGKPKQKTSTHWKPADELLSNSTAWLLSMDANAKVIAAGNEAGEVYVWQRGEKQLWRKFTVRP